MSRATDFMLLIICISIGVFIVSGLGIGESRLSDFNFMVSPEYLVLTGVFVIGAVILAATLAGTSAQGLTFGATVGTKIHVAAGLSLLYGMYAFFAASAAFFFGGIPYIGHITGAIFGLAATVIILFDVADRMELS